MSAWLVPHSVWTRHRAEGHRANSAPRPQEPDAIGPRRCVTWRLGPGSARVRRTPGAWQTSFMKRAHVIAPRSLHCHHELALHVTVFEEVMCVAHRGHGQSPDIPDLGRVQPPILEQVS